MCGAIGINAKRGRNVVPDVVRSMRKIEYRGYDSAGIATVNGHIDCVRAVGKVENIAILTERMMLSGNVAIGHTRWATQGKPTENNAHPHESNGEVAVVHNGTIENFRELRTELQAKQYCFKSETDTEVVPHLIHYYLQTSDTLLEASKKAIARLKGAYALIIVGLRDSSVMIAARNGPPLIIGVGKNEHVVASDASCIVHITNRIRYLEDGDIAEVFRNRSVIYDSAGNKVERPVVTSTIKAGDVDKGLFDHFMQKEIAEQPKTIFDTLEHVLTYGVSSKLFGATDEMLSKINFVRFVACGTSSYAGRIAAQWMESIAGVQSYGEIASEFRGRDSTSNPSELFVAISQSGETMDTIEAIHKAEDKGVVHFLSICNVRESAIPRLTKHVFYTKAGVEIGVASTKAFTAQLAALFILVLAVAKARGRLDADSESKYLQMLRELPGSVRNALQLEPEIKVWAKKIYRKRHALFLGRGTHHCVALEGALKLKEVSYIHAEAYPAGELKHGPIALIDNQMPVIVVAPNDDLFEKLMINIAEVHARGAKVYVLTDEGSTIAPTKGVHVIRVPRHASVLSSVMHVVPLQLLAYHTAVLLKNDVDQPRNLAKSVTVV